MGTPPAAQEFTKGHWWLPCFAWALLESPGMLVRRFSATHGGVLGGGAVCGGGVLLHGRACGVPVAPSECPG